MSKNIKENPALRAVFIIFHVHSTNMIRRKWKLRFSLRLNLSGRKSRLAGLNKSQKNNNPLRTTLTHPSTLREQSADAVRWRETAYDVLEKIVRVRNNNFSIFSSRLYIFLIIPALALHLLYFRRWASRKWSICEFDKGFINYQIKPCYHLRQANPQRGPLINVVLK